MTVAKKIQDIISKFEHVDDQLAALPVCLHDEQGRELPCPVPLLADVSTKPETLKQQVERIMAVSLKAMAKKSGEETPRELITFPDEPDNDPIAMYQVEDMIDEEIQSALPDLPGEVEPSGPEDATEDEGPTE